MNAYETLAVGARQEAACVITLGMRTIEEVKAVLARVSFAPSCVDMGWVWVVQPIGNEGFLICTTFQRPDREDGIVKQGTGGWHHLPVDASNTTIMKRAFVAAKAILEHELMESFLFDGERVFNPHHTIQDLSAAVLHAEVAKIRF